MFIIPIEAEEFVISDFWFACICLSDCLARAKLIFIRNMFTIMDMQNITRITNQSNAKEILPAHETDFLFEETLLRPCEGPSFRILSS